MATDTTRTKSGLLPWLAANRTMAGAGLMIAGIAIAVIPVLLSSWYGTEFLVTSVFTGLLAFVVLAIGVSVRFLPAEAVNAPERLLNLVLALGGLGGLLIGLTGVALLVHWWTHLTDWLSRGTRDGALQILAALAAFLLGLIVMFLTLQLGRAEERQNPTLRRLMYGYNAVFSGLLLLLILAVVNVLFGLKIAWAVDATSSGEFSLSDRTVNMITGLPQPLHIYVIWQRDDVERLPVIKSLLDNIQDRAPHQVHVEYVSPNLDIERRIELQRKYPRKIESIGLLMVYGEEKPENATFLKESDLFEGGFHDSPAKFRGEDKIVAALSSLEGGGSKTVVYVTQGLGEPSLTDSGMNPSAAGAELGLGVLRDRLTARGNFDVKPLKLTPADAKVPDDCKVLVVANPRPPVDSKVADAFRKYLADGNGKAVFLLDVPTSPTGSTVPLTGFEGLLGEYNVEVTTDRVMSVGPIEAGGRLALTDRVIAEISPELAQARTNELAKAFTGSLFLMSDVRLIRPGRPGGRPNAQAQTLLASVEGRDTWIESNWQADPVQFYRQLQRRDPEAVKKLARDRVPTAVIVNAGPKPKLAVFGDVTFATNLEVSERSGSSNFAFFASTLDWLAERPTSIGIEPRNLTVYSLPPTVRFSYLVFLPGLLTVVLILGLGLGVWVVRRR